MLILHRESFHFLGRFGVKPVRSNLLSFKTWLLMTSALLWIGRTIFNEYSFGICLNENSSSYDGEAVNRIIEKEGKCRVSSFDRIVKFNCIFDNHRYQTTFSLCRRLISSLVSITPHYESGIVLADYLPA